MKISQPLRPLDSFDLFLPLCQISNYTINCSVNPLFPGLESVPMQKAVLTAQTNTQTSKGSRMQQTSAKISPGEKISGRFSKVSWHEKVYFSYYNSSLKT